MGLYQSTAASDVTLRSIPDESADTTNSANKEIDFDAALNKIAAETYSKIYNDISNIQKNSLEDSKAKAAELNSKFASIPTASNNHKKCIDQESVLAQCLNNNRGAPLNCEEFVAAYTKCAVDSL